MDWQFADMHAGMPVATCHPDGLCVAAVTPFVLADGSYLSIQETLMATLPATHAPHRQCVLQTWCWLSV
jgi:hypothetical protein